MAFRPGELDQLIKIQRRVDIDDGMGGSASSWVDQFEIWAHVRSMSGREVTEFDRVNAEARYLFVVRYPVDILDADRIEWDGESYNVRARKKPTGRNLYMKVEAERGVSQ